MNNLIREIKEDDEIEASVTVIRASFGTVAREFGLTRENCPTHPSFVTFDQLKELQRKGLRFVGLLVDGELVGFVAVENGDEAKSYMEKLAVLPHHRDKGYGARLVRFVLDHASTQGARILSIGIIDEHTVLKKWYKGLGFAEIGTKKFSHLPFTVCFMEADLARRKLARTPKAIVLDAMGVIYSAGDDVRDLLCPFIAEKGGISDITRIERLYRSASLGQMTASDYWEAVGVPARLEDEYLDRHTLTDGFLDFLAAIRRQGIRLWCLSNDVSDWSRKLRQRFALEEYFAGFIISGDIGSRKPDAAIYQALIRRLTCDPADAVFVDDNRRNVDAAAALGFETILFGPAASQAGWGHRVAHDPGEILALLP